MGVAAKLDRIVQFHRATLSDTGLEMVEAWAPWGQPIAALREDVKDWERARASETQAQISSRFQVRSTPFTRDIDPRDRLECDGAMFEIVGVKEAAQYGRRQLVEISAVRRTDGA